jgi:hypothetical protein
VDAFQWPVVTERYLSVYRSAAGLPASKPEPEPPAVVAELPRIVDAPEWVATA